MNCSLDMTILIKFPDLTGLTQLLIPPNFLHETNQTKKNCSVLFFPVLSMSIPWSPLIAVVSSSVSDPFSSPINFTSLFLFLCLHYNHHRPSHRHPSPRPYTFQFASLLSLQSLHISTSLHKVVKVMCQCGLISDNEQTTLVGDTDNVYVRAEVYGKPLHLPLPFAINLKLL